MTFRAREVQRSEWCLESTPCGADKRLQKESAGFSGCHVIRSFVGLFFRPLFSECQVIESFEFSFVP